MFNKEESKLIIRGLVCLNGEGGIYDDERVIFKKILTGLMDYHNNILEELYLDISPPRIIEEMLK